MRIVPRKRLLAIVDRAVRKKVMEGHTCPRLDSVVGKVRDDMEGNKRRDDVHRFMWWVQHKSKRHDRDKGGESPETEGRHIYMAQWTPPKY